MKIVKIDNSPVLHSRDLSPAERAAERVDAGDIHPQWVRVRGVLVPLGDFMKIVPANKVGKKHDEIADPELQDWDEILPESQFGAILLRYVWDYEGRSIVHEVEVALMSH